MTSKHYLGNFTFVSQWTKLKFAIVIIVFENKINQTNAENKSLVII